MEHSTDKPSVIIYLQLNSVTKMVMAKVPMACHVENIKSQNNYGTTPIPTYDGVTYDHAEISSNDRYNSDGVRLTNVRDILRQDRANYYLYNRINTEDDGRDLYFKQINNKKVFRTAKIKITPYLENKIINSNKSVLITVYILTPNLIEVKERPASRW